MMQAQGAPHANQQITGKSSCKTSDFMLRKKVLDCDQWLEGALKFRNMTKHKLQILCSQKLHIADCFFFLVGGVTRCQRCLTIHYMVQLQNHIAEARTKSISRGITSHLQITYLEPPKPPRENLIDPRCPHRVTAPSLALRIDCSPLPVLSPPLPHRTRNQWCPHAQREGWVTIGLLYLLNVPSYPNPGTTERALKFLLNTGHLQGLSNHSLIETVGKSFFSYL